MNTQIKLEIEQPEDLENIVAQGKEGDMTLPKPEQKKAFQDFQYLSTGRSEGAISRGESSYNNLPMHITQYKMQDEMQMMQDEIRRLYSILNENNIEIESDMSNSYNNYLRTTKSRPSVIRRICINCRKNLTLGNFSTIDRKKRPNKSVCCNCIKNNINITYTTNK